VGKSHRLAPVLRPGLFLLALRNANQALPVDTRRAFWPLWARYQHNTVVRLRPGPLWPGLFVDFSLFRRFHRNGATTMTSYEVTWIAVYLIIFIGLPVIAWKIIGAITTDSLMRVVLVCIAAFFLYQLWSFVLQ
jgi:hypothetical protein